MKDNVYENLRINDDGTLDADMVTIYNMNDIKKLNIVKGDYSIQCSYLREFINMPNVIGGDLSVSGTLITSLKGITPLIMGCLYLIGCSRLKSTYCNYDLDIRRKIFLTTVNELDDIILKNAHHLPIILKYQNYFDVWNEDLRLNRENLEIIIEEIKDGLL